MDYDDVTAGLKAALGTIDGLNVTDSDPDRITPPAVFFGSPDTIIYHGTYGNGLEKAAYTVWLAVSRYPAKTQQRLLNPYMSGSGTKSVRAAVESHTATAWDDATVTGAEGEQVVNVNGTDYLACKFSIQITGSGT